MKLIIHHKGPFQLWSHISGLTLSDPNFGQPGQIDALFGIDVFIECMLKGRVTGPPGTPTAFKTEFGWVLGGLIKPRHTSTRVMSHVSVSCLNK